MFALESLGIAGETYENSDNVKRACDFLVSKQKLDGGWGETYMVKLFFPPYHRVPQLTSSPAYRSNTSSTRPPKSS